MLADLCPSKWCGAAFFVAVFACLPRAIVTFCLKAPGLTEAMVLVRLQWKSHPHAG